MIKKISDVIKIFISIIYKYYIYYVIFLFKIKYKEVFLFKSKSMKYNELNIIIYNVN